MQISFISDGQRDLRKIPIKGAETLKQTLLKQRKARFNILFVYFYLTNLFNHLFTSFLEVYSSIYSVIYFLFIDAFFFLGGGGKAVIQICKYSDKHTLSVKRSITSSERRSLKSTALKLIIFGYRYKL